MLYEIEDIRSIEDKRVILLNSGGLESCFLACMLSKFGFEIHHLFIDYGQNALQGETIAVNNIIKTYGGTLHKAKIDFPWLKDSNVLCSGETVEEYDVPKTMGAVLAGTYVPLRNHLFISVAGSLAEALEIKYIATGLDGIQDCFGVPLGATPDKHPNFAYAIESSINEGSSLYHHKGECVEIIAPILGCTKEDTIRNGENFECDFSISWSCYNGGKKPCGTCCACIDRKIHFDNLGKEEPTFRKLLK